MTTVNRLKAARSFQRFRQEFLAALSLIKRIEKAGAWYSPNRT